MVAIVLAMIFYNALVLVGTAYIVFGLGHSGWWFLLAIVLMAGGSESAKRATP